MSCPLGYSAGGPAVAAESAEKRDALLKAFDALLPDCSKERASLGMCRERVAIEAQNVLTRKFLWRMGVGRGHCVPEMEVTGQPVFADRLVHITIMI